MPQLLGMAHLLHLNVLLETVGKLDDLSKVKSDLSDLGVVMEDPPCLVALHHSPEMLVQILQPTLHFFDLFLGRNLGWTDVLLFQSRN